jgi:hypothetical protein
MYETRHKRVNISQERGADLANRLCGTPCDYTSTSPIGLLNDGVALGHYKRFTSKRQRNRERGIARNRPQSG